MYAKILTNGVNSINESSSQTVAAIKRLDLSNVASRQELPAYIADLVPKSNVKFWRMSEDDKRAYLLKRQEVKRLKDIKTFTNELNALTSDTRKIERITIAVEWKRSSVWGLNPKAKAVVHFDSGSIEVFESSSIGGCGYDKQSTAIAESLNQVDTLRRDLLTLEKSDAYGFYAFTGHFLPRVMGGCGVSAYIGLFNALGFDFENVASGEMFEAYQATRK